jgi:CRISPR/Cas system CMR-associated protein Cmr5 small subunit
MINKTAKTRRRSNSMLKHINLQLFAEDTIPEEKKDTNLDNKPEKKTEESGFSIRKAFGLKDKLPAKEPDKKPDEVKPEDKKPDDVKEPEKEPDKVEFDEILYNKERVKIPVAERQTYLQKGYNYDKVKQTADTANAALHRAAKVEGFDTVDEYLAELDTREKAKIATQIEEAAGDPDKIDEIVKNHPEVVKTKEERQQLNEEKRKIGFDKVVNELKKDQFFKDVEPEFSSLMEQNPSMALDLVSVVYDSLVGKHLRSGKFSEIITKEKESAVKAAIADVHDKERRAAPTGGDTNEGKDTAMPSAFANKLASVFGVSASKIAQRTHEKLKRS